MNFFISLIKSHFPKKIPLSIDDNEIVLRACFHPFTYSDKDKKPKREAFLPNKKQPEAGISVFRLKYTNFNFCKKMSHLQTNENKKFRGYSSITQKILNNLNISELPVTANIVASPMDAKGRYSNRKNVYVGARGLPMHADIFYSADIELNEANTDLRMYANALLKHVDFRFYNDPLPNLTEWYTSNIA